MVSTTQNVFVEGKQSIDASLIANEAIELILENKAKGILWKLDILKAHTAIWV